MNETSSTYQVTAIGEKGFNMEFTIVGDSEKSVTEAVLQKCSRITEERITKIKVKKV